MDNPTTPETPSWGKTIGVFFLCTALAITGAVWTSAMIVSGYGYSGYSTGGIASRVIGIVCAAIYRSTGKVGGPAVGAIAAGVVLGFIVVQMVV